MNRPKSLSEDYRQNRNFITKSPFIKYVPVPVDVQPEFMYYNPLMIRPNERITNRCKSDFNTYYLPLSPKQEVPEMFYKHPGISDSYIYQKPYSNYQDSSQKFIPVDHRSIAYLKYPKYVREESAPSYNENNIVRESGDFYCEYKNNQKFDFCDTLRNNHLFYDDSISESSTKKRSSRTIKHSDFYLQDMQKNCKQGNEEKVKHNKMVFEQLSQKITSKLSPEKQKPDDWRKLQMKKCDNFSEIKTLYNRDNKSQQIYEFSNPTKTHLNKITQTVESEFTKNKINVSTRGTQTDYNGIIIEKQGEEMSNSKKFTESMEQTNIPVFTLDCLQLSKSRTNSFFCPETNIQKNLQKNKPFIFTATSRPQNSHAKLSSPKD